VLGLEGTRAEATKRRASSPHPFPRSRRQLGETIETLLLPIRGLRRRLDELKAEKGWGVCSRLYSLALGLELGGGL
jgi:hypothetical protein